MQLFSMFVDVSICARYFNISQKLGQICYYKLQHFTNMLLQKLLQIDF